MLSSKSPVLVDAAEHALEQGEPGRACELAARAVEEEALAELVRAEISRARGDEHSGLHHAQRTATLGRRRGTAIA